MGLWDTWRRFFGGNPARRHEGYAKLVHSARSIREDRLAAIEYFMELDDADTVVPVLLRRFDFSLEHWIFDEKEKEMCVAGIVRFGDKAVPHAREHLRVSPLIAWPIKVLTKLLPGDAVVEDVKACLNYDDIDFDEALVNKNLDILRYLADFKLPGFTPRLMHFLEDHDERIRFACVELLLAQDDPDIPVILARYLMDASAENRRLRRAVVDAFVDRGWRVPDPSAIPGGMIEPGITIDAEGKLRREEWAHSDSPVILST